MHKITSLLVGAILMFAVATCQARTAIEIVTDHTQQMNGGLPATMSYTWKTEDFDGEVADIYNQNSKLYYSESADIPKEHVALNGTTNETNETKSGDNWTTTYYNFKLDENAASGWVLKECAKDSAGWSKVYEVSTMTHSLEKVQQNQAPMMTMESRSTITWHIKVFSTDHNPVDPEWLYADETLSASVRVTKSATGFEGLDTGTFSVADYRAEMDGKVHFYLPWDTGDYACSIEQYSGGGYAGGKLPLGFDGIGEQFLRVNTDFSKPLYRSVNPVVNGTAGEPYQVEDELWFDALVHPTYLDESPQWNVQVAAPLKAQSSLMSVRNTLSLKVRPRGLILNIDDKMRLYWQEVYDENEEPVATNLFVQAGRIDSPEGPPALATYTLSVDGLDFSSDDWYRVTVRALKDMTGGTYGIVGFEVYVNGRIASADKCSFSQGCLEKECGNLPEKERKAILERRIIAAYGHGVKPSPAFTFTSYEGRGEIDDISVSAVGEQPVDDRIIEQTCSPLGGVETVAVTVPAGQTWNFGYLELPSWIKSMSADGVEIDQNHWAGFGGSEDRLIALCFEVEQNDTGEARSWDYPVTLRDDGTKVKTVRLRQEPLPPRMVVQLCDVGVTRLGFDTDERDEDIYDVTRQPIGRESFGVQATVHFARGTELLDGTIDPTTVRAYVAYHAGTDVWGYENWCANAEWAELKLVSTDDGLTYRSSLSKPGSLCCGFEPVMQYCVKVHYIDAGAEVIRFLDRGEWVQPVWYQPVDLNQSCGNGNYFSAYTLLDEVPPRSVWVNEVNVFDGYDDRWGNIAATNQFIEIAAPAGMDLAGWYVNYIERGYEPVRLWTFGQRGVPSVPMPPIAGGPTNGYVFLNMVSPKTYRAHAREPSYAQWDALSNPREGELPSETAFAIQLCRPSGVVEQTVILAGTNFWAGTRYYDLTEQLGSLQDDIYATCGMVPMVFAGLDQDAGSISVMSGNGQLVEDFVESARQTPSQINAKDGVTQSLEAFEYDPTILHHFVAVSTFGKCKVIDNGVDQESSWKIVQVGTDLTVQIRVEPYCEITEAICNGQDCRSSLVEHDGYCSMLLKDIDVDTYLNFRADFKRDGSLPEGAYETEVDGVPCQFYVKNGEVTIGAFDQYGNPSTEPAMSWPQPSGTVYLPSTIAGFPVVRIAKSAFAYETNLKGIVIPEGVREIDAYAFFATGLEFASLPETLERIGASAFAGCYELADVALPSNVRVVEDRAFESTAIEVFHIPASVESFGEAVLDGCWYLPEVSVAEENEHYFADDGSLFNSDATEVLYWPLDKEISIPSTVVKIGESAFANNLTMTNGEVAIPDSVKIIGSCAFSCCYADKITIGSSVEEIGVVAFQNNYCESYVIPPSVRVIGGGAFASNPYLLSVCFEGDKPQVEVPIYQGSDFATTYVKSGSLGWGDLPASWPIDVTRPDADEFARPLKVWENYPEVPKDCQVDFAYEVNHDGSVTITGCPDGKLPPRLHIPESIDGRTVTGIADFAFSGCGYSFDELVIPATVETIGYGAFYDCWISSLAVPSCVIRLPDSFMCQDSLRELAFTDDREIFDDYFAAYFYNLEVVKFPEGVTSIGCAAFACCNLSVLELPDGVKTIGDRAFEGSQNLVKVTIPSSVEYIGRGVFGECFMLYEVEILSCMRDWLSAFFNCRNVVRATVPGFTGDYSYTQGSIGECFPNLRELKILEGTTGLWQSMCRNLNNLCSVELPSTLTKIMDQAFFNCYSLTNVEFKGVTTVIGRDAFERCSSLTSIELKEGLKEVGDYAFAECTNLERADIPMSVEQLGYNVFYGCNKLIIDNLYIPGPVQYVNSWTYAGMKGIRSVTIGEGVYTIGSGAFEGCSGITNVFLPDSLERIDWSAFRDCTGLSEITIPENVYEVGYCAFEGCTNLNEVTLMDGSIWFNNAFVGCVNVKTLNLNVPESGGGGGRAYHTPEEFGGNLLTVNILDGARKLPGEYLVYFNFMHELNLPEGLEVIEKMAVQFCQNLQSVSLPSTLLEIQDNAFEGCRLESLQLPDCLQVIGDYAFYRGLYPTSPIRIPSTVKHIGAHAFDGVDLSMLDFGADNPYYRVEGDVLYRLENGVKVEIVMAAKSLEGPFFCPDTVRVIGECAFEGCVGLTSICLPEGLKKIGDWAFDGCKNVSRLNIPMTLNTLPGSAIRSIDFDAITIAEGNATYYKDGLYIYRRLAETELELTGADRDCPGDLMVPAGLVSIGDYACYGCTNLTSVILTSPIQSVGALAFYGCLSLSDLVIGDSMISIGESAFEDCVSIEELVVPSSVVKVGGYAFYGCRGAKMARLSCSEICNGAFIECSALKTLEMDDNVRAIGAGAFQRCTNLNSVVIGSGMELVGSTAFYGCDSLRSVKIASGEIGSSAFTQCPSLSDIQLGEGVTKIGSNAFSSCTNLISVVIPEGVSQIGYAAFGYCTSLQDVSILGGTLESGVFTGCDRLENLYIGAEVKGIPDSFLSYANGFRSVTIDSHAVLGSRAFYYNYSLECAAVSSETIGDYAFYQCENLSSVKLRDSVTEIGDWAFVGCTALGEIVIPASVADLGYNSFGDCVALTCVSFCGAPPRSIADSRILKYANSVRYPRQYAAEYAPYVTEDQFAGFSDPEPPVITPGDGTVFDSSLTVNITASDPLAKIHVTTNGTDPTVDSPIMRRFRVYGKTTVKAIAVTDDAAMPSMVTTTHYAPGRAENPVFSVPDGTVVYERDFTVTISHRESDGVLRYTTDGSEPDETSAVYGGPISVPDSMTIKAKVFSEKFFDSDVVSVSLVREIAVVPMPEISAPDGSTFVGSLIEVSISCAKGGAVIHYTTDGTEPTDQSPVYAKPFKIFDTTVIKAFAMYSDWIDSPVASSTIEKVMGRGDYIGAPDFIFEDGEDEPWVVEHDIGLADGCSLRNGDVYAGGTSTLKTSVNGTGKVMFMWRTDTMEDVDLHDWNHVEFLVDGKEVARLDGELDEWRQVSHMIETSGDHVLEWRFVRPYDDSLSMADCAWVDSFIWIPNGAVAATVKTDTPVPYKWLDKYGLLGEFTPDDAALAPSGKYDASGRPLFVWEDYVTGTDPTNPESKFTATITIVEGEPVVTWSPKLTPEEAALRKYTTYGCSELGGEWYNTDDAPAEVKSQLRFFKVGVEMK